MLPRSPSAGVAEKLVFGNSLEETMPPPPIAGSPTADIQDNAETRVSMYVSLFEDMLATVLRHEHYLLTLSEIDYLARYSKMSYHARYLLVRLCLRKTDKWHRLSSIKYEGELGDNIRQATAELCGKINPPTSDTPAPPPDASSECSGSTVTAEPLHLTQDLLPFAEVKTEPQETVISDAPGPRPKADTEIPDLEMGAEDAEQPRSTLHAAEAASQEHAAAPQPEGKAPRLEVNSHIAFAEDESGASLRDLLECLTVEELKAVAKQFKVKGSAKDVLIGELIRTCSKQTTLGFFMGISSRRGKPGKPALTQSNVFLSGQTQSDRLKAVVMKTLEKCVRVNNEIVKLLRRINVVYFRKTQQVTSLLTESILAYAQKRSYTSYKHSRTHDIWPSRADLLAYEDALEKEALVDEILDGTSSLVARARSTASRTPGQPAKRVKMPATPKKNEKATADNKMDVDNDHASVLGEEDGSVGPSRRKAHALKPIFEEVYERWKILVKIKGEEIDPPRARGGLERFECGHVLTRVVCKGSAALSMLGEHENELEVLEALLAQKRWRRGRRGRWYERRALLLMKFKQYERAKEAVIEALEDEDTHIVFRPKLERRLTTLEKRLKVPEEERHVCEGKLDKAAVVEIVGTRVYHRDQSLKLDPFGRNINKSARLSGKATSSASAAQRSLLAAWVQPAVVPLEKHPPEESPKWTGKSIWEGRDGEEVTVEMLALQHYESKGYKGFHSEGRVVTTLFGLLFWDIIFADIPGAFETPYQRAPLDIAEDTFYYARKDLIDQRLDELKAGQGPDILARVLGERAESKTWCVGVRWDLFEKGDLLEITKSLGGVALAVICELMCEDYSGRCGGVPDLIIWNDATQICKFVEVKGPGDRLQENQKVWIDVLLQAGVAVEECRVVERGNETVTPKKEKKKVGRPPKRKRAAESDDEGFALESENEEEGIDYSQLDVDPVGAELDRPSPKKPPIRKVVNRAVVITTSPVGSPAKRRRQARNMSPEV